jgi:hypothetical protein
MTAAPEPEFPAEMLERCTAAKVRPFRWEDVAESAKSAHRWETENVLRTAEEWKREHGEGDKMREALVKARQRIFDCKHNAMFSSKDTIVRHVAELLPEIDAALGTVEKER